MNKSAKEEAVRIVNEHKERVATLTEKRIDAKNKVSAAQMALRDLDEQIDQSNEIMAGFKAVFSL